MESGVKGAGDAVVSLRLVPGEVGELRQDDVDGDRIDEAGEHGIRHEPHDRPQPEQSGCEHEQAGQHPERHQRQAGIRAVAHRGNVRDDDGHRAGPLDRHQDRARGDGPGQRAEQVAVEPCHWIDTREET